MTETNTQKLLPLPNPEKELHEKWDENRGMFNFPRPFRWFITAQPNCGKTTLIINYLAQASVYDRIFILHPACYNPQIDQDDEHTNKNLIVPECSIPEYGGVEYYALQYIPNESFFKDLTGYTLFIIDDIDLLQYQKAYRYRSRVINKLFSYVSTHNNISIITTSQSPSSQIPSIVFQMSNIVTVFDMDDKYKIRTLAQKMGNDQNWLISFLNLCNDEDGHDNITFDYTIKSPYKFRKNIFQVIKVTYAAQRYKKNLISKKEKPSNEDSSESE